MKLQRHVINHQEDHPLHRNHHQKPFLARKLIAASWLMVILCFFIATAYSQPFNDQQNRFLDNATNLSHYPQANSAKKEKNESGIVLLNEHASKSEVKPKQ